MTVRCVNYPSADTSKNDFYAVESALKLVERIKQKDYTLNVKKSVNYFD